MSTQRLTMNPSINRENGAWKYLTIEGSHCITPHRENAKTGKAHLALANWSGYLCSGKSFAFGFHHPSCLSSHLSPFLTSQAASAHCSLHCVLPDHHCSRCSVAYAGSNPLRCLSLNQMHTPHQSHHRHLPSHCPRILGRTCWAPPLSD